MNPRATKDLDLVLVVEALTPDFGARLWDFLFFDGSHICRFLQILRPATVPRSHFSYPKNKGVCADYQPLIFADSNFRIGK